MRSDKKAAMEMSVGTIVTVVLAMMMLIGGILLIKNIIEGSTDNVDTMNQKTKDQISKLFTEDKKVVINLPNKIAKIKQNKDWGVGFAIKNLNRGTPDAEKFTYEVVVDDADIQEKCGISENDILKWITTGRTGSSPISPGETYFGIVRFLIPDSAPLCTVRFNLVVDKEGDWYYTELFDVEVEA